VGGLKVSPPPYEIKIFGKNGILEENFDFFGQKMTFFQKIFGASRDFHKSAVKFSKKI
jgi:hypothetical protein